MNQSEIQKLLQELGNHLEDLKNLFSSTTEDKLSHKPSNNIWSAKELLGHLSDSELVFYYRIQLILEEESPSYSGFNPDARVAKHDYNQWDTSILIDNLIALRKKLIFFLGRLPESDWARIGDHEKAGKETIQSIVEKLSKHYNHHVKQIKERTQ